MSKKSLLQGIRNGIVIANKLVDTTVLAVIIAAVILSIFALTDISRVMVNGSSEQYAIYKPKEDKKSFEELQAINPEVIGWITVYGTAIDYPITQAKDNDKYLMYGPDLKYSLLGSIFLDAGNKPGFSDFNSILYGHNMTPRAMFGNIKDYKDEAFFDAHRYGDLFYNNKHHGLVIFALYEEDGYHSFVKQIEFPSDESKQAYVNEIFTRAIASRQQDVDVTKDHIVTMYTCSNVGTNVRELLVALITDETYEDPYQTEPEEDLLGRLKGWFEFIPLWIWPYLILLILLIILYMVNRAAARKEQEERDRIKEETEKSGEV